MAKRIVSRIGNVFCVEFGQKYKRFFQYVANDLEMLNSSVIRVFKKRYSTDYKINIDEIVSDDVDFVAHTILRTGIENGTWYKIGTSKNLGLDHVNEIIFAETPSCEIYDFPLTREVNPLNNWYIWHINEGHHKIGRMTDSLRTIVEPGSVIPYSMIRYRMEYGFYNDSSEMYDVIPRKPYSDVDTYVKQIVDGDGSYLHFFGADAVEELVVENGQRTKLTLKHPESNGHKLRSAKFWKTNWDYYDFITKEEFEKVWDAI